jgi:hypothetical protein
VRHDCFLNPAFGRSLDPLAASRVDIERYVRRLQDVRRYQPSTVSRLSVVAGCYRVCVIDRILAHSPAEYVRRPLVPPESPSRWWSAGAGVAGAAERGWGEWAGQRVWVSPLDTSDGAGHPQPPRRRPHGRRHVGRHRRRPQFPHVGTYVSTWTLDCGTRTLAALARPAAVRNIPHSLNVSCGLLTRNIGATLP